MKSPPRRLSVIQIALVDLLIALAAYYLAFFVRSRFSFWFFHEPLPTERLRQVTHYLPVLALTQIFLFYVFGLYDIIRLQRGRVLPTVLLATGLQVPIMAAVYFFTLTLEFPRSVFPVYWLLNTGLVWTWRRGVMTLQLRQQRVRSVLIVGTNEAARALVREIERLPIYNLRVVGFVDGEESRLGDEFMGYPILGSRGEILDLTQRHGVDEIIIAATSGWQERLIHELGQAGLEGPRLSIIPSVYEILIGKIQHLRIYDIPLVEVLGDQRLHRGRLFKRILDLIAATALLVAFLPVMALVALTVRLTSRGPVLFRQTRVGERRRLFTIYKFRTMVAGAEDVSGPVLSTARDVRLTPLGRLLRRSRLDELPQLWNILKGEMSFVGPRPERPFFVTGFVSRIAGYDQRFLARPGLTGLAQVNGGYATTPEVKLKYDLAYIYNQSPWLDARILFETLKVIVTGHGAR